MLYTGEPKENEKRKQTMKTTIKTTKVNHTGSTCTVHNVTLSQLTRGQLLALQNALETSGTPIALEILESLKRSGIGDYTGF